jgi:hypothetical protein
MKVHCGTFVVKHQNIRAGAVRQIFICHIRLRLAFEDRRRARALERECQRGLAVAVWDNPLVPDVHDFLFRRPRHRKRAAEKPAPTASKTAEKRGHEGRETADGFSATGEALA